MNFPYQHGGAAQQAAQQLYQQQPSQQTDFTAPVIPFNQERSQQYYNQPSAYNTAQFQTPTPNQLALQQQQLAAAMQANPNNNQFSQLASFIDAAQWWAADSQNWFEVAMQQQATLQNLAALADTAQWWAADSQNWFEAATISTTTAEYLYQLLNDPEFLIYHAFNIWWHSATPEDGPAMNAIAENFLLLTDRFDTIFAQKYGTPPSSPNTPPAPFVPVPGTNNATNPGLLQQQIERLKNPHPDLAKQLQLEHNARRQMISTN